MRLARRELLGLVAASAAAPLWARGPASYPPPDREAMLPVPGGRVYVRVNGRLDGPRPPVVMVHGGPGGTHAAFLDTLALSDERAVILYDQLGGGRSERPDVGSFPVARYVDELEAVRAGLGLKRWHVLGHSWGGTVALEYGARRPAALAGLVLAGPLVSTRSWLADANILRGRLPAAVQRDLAACEGPRPPAEKLCDAATDAFYAAYNQRTAPSDGFIAYQRSAGTGNRRIYREMWGASEFVSTGTLKDYDGEPLLPRLPRGRTLFIVGQYDEARPATVEGFALRAPDADFAVVPGASHSIFEDRPAETLGILRPWLRQHDA